MKKTLLSAVSASFLLIGGFAAVSAPSHDTAELPSVYSNTKVAAELPSVYSKELPSVYSVKETASELPSVYSSELPSVY
jgi:hypothetical protein